jgi:tetratricopeptide (TPR) repeat protein
MFRTPALIALLFSSAWASAGQDPMREAARLDAEGKCGESEAFYAQTLSAGTPSASLLNNAGNHYMVCGQPVRARALFEQLLKINPRHPNANLQLARIAAGERQGTKALEYLSRVAESGPAVLLLKAEALHWSGQRAAAASLLDGVAAKAGGDPRVLFTLGLTCARMGLFDRAETAFAAVLASNPENPEVLLNLGRAAARAGHYDRAQRTLETALRVQPDAIDALVELGLLCQARRDPTRAVYLLAQARQRAPQRPDILLALARAAEDAGFYGDSALAYDEYLALRPADDTARRDRALVLGYTGTRLEEGIRELNAYLEKHPRDPVGWYHRARFHWPAEPEKALAALDRALKLDSEFAAAYFARGWMLHRLGRTAETIPDLEKAVRLDPKNFRARTQLGIVYRTLDKPEAAEKVLREALALAPDDPDTLVHLGRALLGVGREEEAQSLLDRFQKVRKRAVRPRQEAGLIESAGMPAAERAERNIERFRALAQSRPAEVPVAFQLASLLLAQGRIEEAAAEFSRLLGLNPPPATCHQAGTALLEAEQYDLARQFLERAVGERPGARLDLAVALFFSRGFKEALDAIGEPPPGQPAGDYLLMKARILDAAGRPEEAQRALRDGLTRPVSRVQILGQAAMMLVAHHHPAEALQVLDRAIGQAPGNPDLLLARASVLALAGRDDAARTAFDAIEARWPEWDRPYVIHGLFLESRKRPEESRRKLRTALALGSRDAAAHCALARLNSAPAPSGNCACLTGLEPLLIDACGR